MLSFHNFTPQQCMLQRKSFLLIPGLLVKRI